MKTELTSSAPSPHPTEALAKCYCAVTDALLEAGVHPHRVAEAALLAFVPLALEVTKADTIEIALYCLAHKFQGNELRREN